MFIYCLTSVDITDAYGEGNIVNWKKYFRSLDYAKKVAKFDYESYLEGDEPEKIRWKSIPKKAGKITTQSLLFVMYEIEALKVEDVT